MIKTVALAACRKGMVTRMKSTTYEIISSEKKEIAYEQILHRIRSRESHGAFGHR